eukprot:gb/GECG01006292.1/.p1 GENE.gb/GECG01006292.1/~~gb/GECG01006292.1/.p1  ORF type:complete len:175 (+),score=14.65 gb/GECG01006292.1/:1-525(+)
MREGQAKDRLAAAISSFLFTTARGTESALYQTITREELLNKASMGIKTTYCSIKYLNICYKSIIRRDNQFITDSFDHMTSIMQHSEICLLHLILNCLRRIHGMIERQYCDLSSREAYRASLAPQLIGAIATVYPSLVTSVNHGCTGTSIRNEDPEQELFTMEVGAHADVAGQHK